MYVPAILCETGPLYKYSSDLHLIRKGRNTKKVTFLNP